MPVGTRGHAPRGLVGVAREAEGVQRIAVAPGPERGAAGGHARPGTGLRLSPPDPAGIREPTTPHFRPKEGRLANVPGILRGHLGPCTVLLASLLLLAGCGGARGADLPSRPRDARAEPLFRLLASAKTWPAEFSTAAQHDVLVQLATDGEALAERWTRFGFEGAPPSPRWEAEVVLFLATGESRTCPLEVKVAEFDATAGRLVLYLEPRAWGSDVCTMDFTPRSLALAVPRPLLDAGWREVQVRGVSGDPILPVGTTAAGRAP